MRHFNVYGNQLSGPLPAEYAAWTALIDFDVHDNQITCPKRQFGKFTCPATVGAGTSAAPTTAAPTNGGLTFGYGYGYGELP